MHTNNFFKHEYTRIHTNAHEYTRIHTNIFLNTNFHELFMNYPKIIYDYSCLFMIIRVEKKEFTIILLVATRGGVFIHVYSC